MLNEVYYIIFNITIIIYDLSERNIDDKKLIKESLSIILKSFIKKLIKESINKLLFKAKILL